MRFRRALTAAVLGLAASGCDDGGVDDGAGGADAGVLDGTSSAPGAGAGSAGDGGSTADGPSSGIVASTGVGDTGVTSSGTGSPVDCLGGDFLDGLGRDRVMVGASLGDELATTTPLDIRYRYLAGALPDGAGPCSACDEGCSVAGSICDSQDAGCGWWGCWQDFQDAPGAYVRTFTEEARARGQIPMVTYYLVLQSSGAEEGAGEVAAVSDADYLARYLSDFRFMLQQLGGGPALIHVEPDFWGYAQQTSSDPNAIPAAVPDANPSDCGAEPPTIAGLGRCLVHMARIYAPGARIGLHGSAWATGYDVLLNEDADLDVAAPATALGSFLAATAPDADLVFVDAADRDAGYDATMGEETWWDATNATLPSFHQAFAWSSAVSEAAQRPHLWWQVPFGNEALSGDAGQWNDNRLDYFFANMSEVAAAHGVGVAFGAGADGQVTAETDGGNFVAKASDYAASGGVPLCGPASDP